MKLIIVIISAFAVLQLSSGSGIGVDTNIQAAGFFQPKWPYNASTINYPYAKQLDNGYVCKYGTNIPGADMYQAMLTLAPCNYITEHYHPEASEFNHILKGGALKWHIVLGNGSLIHGQTELGSSHMMPQGLTHLILNDNCESTTFFHYFTVINPIFMFSVPALVNMPHNFKVDTFGRKVGRKLNMKNVNLPDGIHTLDSHCLKRCGLKAKDFKVGGKYSPLCKRLNPQGY